MRGSVLARWAWKAVAIVVAWPASASADIVFFDDFVGNALLPHWNQPPPTEWEYNVSNGMLSVTALHYPSHPHSPSNYTGMEAAYAQQSDFRLDVWMGWDDGPQPHMLECWVGGPSGGIIALFGYRFDSASGPGPVVIAGASNQALSMPAPAPGIHQFTITRTGPLFAFYLDGSPFASFVDSTAIPAGRVSFFFLGPFPGQFGPLHIDRVQVVPAPGAVGLLWGLGLLRARRARRVR